MTDIEGKSDHQIAKLRNENFYRMSPKQLVALLQQSSAPQNMAGQEESKESIFNMGGDNPTIVQIDSAQIGVTSDSSFILLDLRDKSDYSDWHIREAYSFPLTLLNQDKTIPEAHRFKNKEGKRIVIYTNDERNGIAAARTMADRGYENTYLLSGGIEKFIEDYASLVEGNNIPQLVAKEPAGAKRGGRK